MSKRNICTWQDSIYEKRDAQQNLSNNPKSHNDSLDTLEGEDGHNNEGRITNTSLNVVVKSAVR
jgi:hypothetical protein